MTRAVSTLKGSALEAAFADEVCGWADPQQGALDLDAIVREVQAWCDQRMPWDIVLTFDSDPNIRKWCAEMWDSGPGQRGGARADLWQRYYAYDPRPRLALMRAAILAARAVAADPS